MEYHQIFIIAHIKDRYRCLAKVILFDVERPYRISVPLRCERLISIFESSSNAMALSSELNNAKTLPSSFWGDKEANDDPVARTEYPEHPFSYIKTCLTVGASWDPIKNIWTQVSVARDTKSYQYGAFSGYGGNTILDITHLKRVRYAFEKSRRFFARPSLLTRRSSLLKRLCTAAEYLGKYNYARAKEDSDDLKAEHHLACSACLDHELLDVAAFISAWPDSPFSAPTPAENDEGDVTSGSPDTYQNIASSQTATLKKASMDKVFDELLMCTHEELKAMLSTATLLSDFWPTVKSKLFNNPILFHLGPDKGFGAVRLLLYALEHEETIDLCPCQLTTDQLEYFLISGPMRLQNLKILNLSGSRHLTEGLLRKIILNHTNLTTLYLLNTPHIPLQTKLGTLKGSGITEFLDSKLLSFAFIGAPEAEIHPDPRDEKDIVGVAQKQAVRIGERKQEETRYSRKAPSLNYMPLPVSQVMLVGLKVCNGGVVDINRILRRDYSPIYGFPFNLNGLNRSLSACLFNMVEYMQRLLSRRDQDDLSPLHFASYDNMKKFLGICLARDSCPDAEALKIHPIPPGLYEDRKKRRSGYQVGVPTPTPLSPGQWTLMIGHALPHNKQGDQSSVQGTSLPPALYYAFLSTEPDSEGNSLSKELGPASQNRLITEDIDGLLRRLEVDTPTREQIVTLWHERLGKLRIRDYWGPDSSKLLECSVEACSTEDAEFLLEYAMKGV
ncbi:hypothetical protein HYFRA_00006630 [Hymenoscyphus fraxineus]|uniref:Uncharacterized protein n=1 Tax=Hymenoscyphus fraxineus TaxID=746836 RepID=A0A9N9KT56_9HELO|nr:hypothetical protein HYFRA_00006630 [Hymenoscyphus fraxineus]